MADMITVTLHKNGKYWQARWRDPRTGKLRGKGLGATAKVSKRAATVKARDEERKLNRGKVQNGQAPTLQDYIDRFIEARTDLAPGTVKLYRLTGRYLTGHFGETLRIDKIIRPDATDWRTALAKGRLAHINKQNKGTPAESTVCRCCKEAKTMFKAAVDDDLIEFNPFDRLKSSAPPPDKTWEYVDRQTLRRLLDKAPNDSWKLLVALCRLAGLRRGECERLKWSDIDLDRRRIIANNDITHQTTKRKRREIPIDPELHKLLFEVFMDGQGGERVLPDLRGSLYRGFQLIAGRANVPMYSRPYHTLRKNCETDWMEQHPVMVVCEWLGHSADVAAKHYHRAKDEQFDRASGLECSQKCSQSTDDKTQPIETKDVTHKRP